MEYITLTKDQLSKVKFAQGTTFTTKVKTRETSEADQVEQTVIMDLSGETLERLILPKALQKLVIDAQQKFRSKGNEWMKTNPRVVVKTSEWFGAGRSATAGLSFEDGLKIINNYAKEQDEEGARNFIESQVGDEDMQSTLLGVYLTKAKKFAKEN